jgi:hypothetical protein
MEQTRPEAIIGDSEMAHELWFLWGHNTVGNIPSPTWEFIESNLNEIRQDGGTARLYIQKLTSMMPEGKLSPRAPDGKQWYEIIKSLELMFDEGKFILNFSEDKGDDIDIISYWNPGADPALVAILGDSWDGRMICADFNIAVKFFKEFFETGDITKDHFL